MAKDINKLAKFILSWEGGYANVPGDAGGPTNKGVTLTTWKAQGYDKDGDGDIDVQDLKLITDKDVVNVVLRPHFWNRWKADDIKDEWIAYLLVDWVWGSGKWGITKVQQWLGVKVDGVVGPKTIAALNSKDPKMAFKQIWDMRKAYLNAICVSRPVNKKFLKGWLNRLNSMQYGYIKTAKGEILK